MNTERKYQRAVFYEFFSSLLRGIDRYTLSVTLFGTAMLIVYLHQGKAAKLALYFPTLYEAIPPQWQRLSAFAYSHLSASLILMLLPLIFASVFIRASPRDLGFRFKGTQREWIIACSFLALILPLVFIASQTDSFQQKYPKLKAISYDAQLFFLYQSIYIVKWISWEFFFRGFWLFTMKKRFGDYAILITTLPFVFVHLGKPEGEVFGAVIAGIVLGRLALNSGSIFPGVLLHYGVAASMDFFTSHWWR